MNQLLRYFSVLVVGAAASVACATSDDASGLAQSRDTTAPTNPTFHKDVEPLLQQQCQACHHAGGLAPFPIETYAQAKGYRNLIKKAVVTGKMPEARPVRLDTGCSKADTFAGPRRLTQDEINIFANWADQGAPEGDPADAPPPVSFHDPLPGEWTIGTPDLDIQNTEGGFNIPPHVPRDIFRRFPIKTNYDTDKYISAIEAHPDNGSWAGKSGTFPIVHHMELWIDWSGKSVDQEARYQLSHPNIEGPGFEGEWDFPETPLLLGMWVPGATPPPIPKGFAYKLPKGAVLVFEVHYAGDRVNEYPINDRSHWGIHFSDEPNLTLFNAYVTRNEEFDVPANVAKTNAEWSYTFDRPVTLYGITPHMHQLGRYYHVEIIRPDTEAPQCLADLEWNFEHQNAYFLNQPRDLPAGSKVRWVCEYDNTEMNPRQFNHPPIDVKSGRTSRDEMCQLTLNWVNRDVDRAANNAAATNSGSVPTP